MKLTVVALSLSAFTSVFAMEPKEFRKTTQAVQDASTGESAMVPFDTELAMVPFMADEEVDAWLADAVDVSVEDLQMVPVGGYANTITIVSPEARARFLAAYTTTTDVCYYTGTQLFCIAQVGLAIANNFLTAANNALDKAEEIEEGVAQVLDKAEVVKERAGQVRDKFNGDIARANTIFEGKKPAEGKGEEKS